MKRNKLKVQKVVGILTDPHPEFVSLVNFPANQTPFTSVKFDKLASEAGEDAAALAQRAASSVVSIASVSFSKKQFKSVEAVTAYMEENGYANYTVENRGDYYLVPGESAEGDDVEDTGEIEVAKGVTMSVARHRSVRKSAAAPATTENQEPSPAAKSDNAVRSHKSLYSLSYFANVLTSAGYILSDMKWEQDYDADGDADNEVLTKFKGWLSDGARLFETMASDEVAKLVEWASKAKADREAQMTETTKAKGTVDTKTTPVAAPGKAPTAVKPNDTSTVSGGGTPEATPPAADDPTQPKEGEGGTPPASGDASNPGGEPTAGTETGSTENNGEGEGKTEAGDGAPSPEASANEPSAKSAPATGFDAKALTDAIGSAVATAIKPLAEEVTELAKAVKSNDDRVSAMEERRQTRRSGDHETAGGTPPEPPKDTEASKKEAAWTSRMSRDTFGLG